MAKTYKKELLLILFSYPISSVIDNIFFIIGNISEILHSYGIPISLFGDTYGLPNCCSIKSSHESHGDSSCNHLEKVF